MDLKEIEKKLEERLGELTKRLENIDDQLGELGDDDFSEMATESADDEALEGIGRTIQAEVNQIVVAMGRVKNGTYGKCASCGSRIRKERLDALPYATRCIKCA
ncbi:MAG: TraR/DksA C4-type zinc finger protein [SAR324 cluster bacterium]|nr:TraR/DksA C4-type zinc finger protein [SAR324 cluster bacterium]